MALKYPHLFSPVKLGPVQIKNRLFQSVGEILLSEQDRGFTKRYVDYYAERAKNGVGLFVTGHVKMECKLDPYPMNMPSLDRDFKLFVNLCETVHSYGAKIAMEINPGAGRLGEPWAANGFLPGSADAGPLLYVPGLSTYQLTREEIKQRVEIYGQACATAKAAGVDIIYVNCQAYLNDQFLTPAWNHRTDEYGGSLENRMRFIMEQIDACRAACGENFPIMASISMDQGIEGGKTLEDWIAIAQAFEKKGLVAVHMRNGSYDAGEWNSDSMTHSYMREGLSSQPNVDKVRPHVNIPIISDGSFRMPEDCEKVLAEGRLDMVGVDRGMIADPEWARKAREGRPEDIRPCLRCMECMSRYVENKCLGCAVNPLVGREAEAYTYHPVEKKKKVLVIGGGHSGMLTAIYAAKRGHDITVVEKDGVLGGHMLQASASPYKHEYRAYTEWLKRELGKSGAKVQLNTAVDKKFVEDFAPDAIVVSSGSVPAVPPIPGVKGENVTTAMDALLDHSGVGGNVVLIGSGMVGCECAIDLAMAGKKVTMIEMLPEIGREIIVMMKASILTKLGTLGVNMLASTRTTEITAEGVKVVNAEGREEFIPCDTVVMATGLRSDNSLFLELSQEYPEVYLVGDGERVGRFIDSGRAAYNVAQLI